MGSTFSKPSLNVEFAPDVSEDPRQEKQELEEDLTTKVMAFLLAESDMPFNALSLKHVELFLRCRSSNDISDILDDVDGFYDPYFDTTLRLIIFINAERSHQGFPPSTFIELSRDASKADGGPIQALLDKEALPPNDYSNPYRARLLHMLSEGVTQLCGNKERSLAMDSLKFFAVYPLQNPYKSPNYSIPGSRGKILWRFYESWSNGYILAPCRFLDETSLQEGDIYIHTRFEDIGHEERAEYSQAWQRAGQVWNDISFHYAKAGRGYSIYHPLNKRYVVHPTYQGVPRYMEVTDAKISRILRGEF